MTNINNATSEDNGSAHAHCQTKRREKKEYEIGRWPLDSLRNEVFSQLDRKRIKDKKNGLCKSKYKERARSYIHQLPVEGLDPSYIDSSDLSRRVIEELNSINNGTADYVMKEVIGRIFDSIDELYIKLSVRGHLDWMIYPD